MGFLQLAALVLVVGGAPAYAASVDRWGSYLNGEHDKLTLPAAVPVPEPVAVDASNSSSYALDAQGRVWAWGNGERGQLGNGQLVNSPTSPVEVHIPRPVVAIGEARNEGAAIDNTGHAWVWGENGQGSLCVKPLRIATPVEVPGLSGLREVQGGENHTVWLTESGHVLACGNNAYGELGVGSAVTVAHAPVETSLSSIVEISAGDRTTAARDSEGHVWAFGLNEKGAVGTGTCEPTKVYLPIQVSLPGAASEVADGGDLGSNGSMLALVGGEVFGWGFDTSGQVGDRSTVSKCAPTATGLHFAQVATGGIDSFGLDSEGNLWGWGSEIAGELGDGKDTGKVLVPKLILTGVASVSATAQNAEALLP